MKEINGIDIKNNDIYSLKLHEKIQIVEDTQTTTIMRVAGGWVYTFVHDYAGAIGSVFVPFHNEFQF